MNVSAETVELALDVPFTIARGTKETVENVVVAIERDGKTGYGAAAPSPRYGETTATVEALLPELRSAVEAVDDPHARRRVAGRMADTVRGNPAAKAAVDVALWDLAGKLLGEPVYRLLGTAGVDGTCPPTSFTVGLDDTDVMVERAEKALEAGYGTLKLKLGSDRDLGIVESVRDAVPEATLRVDANEAWGPAEAIRHCRALESRGVEFVEQPVPAGDREGLKRVHDRSPLPIAVDESCRTAADVPSVADRCDIVNLKLMKTGGVTPAVDAIATARAHGLEVMCGCMIETNASIAGATQLLPLLDYADLDGSLLLADDPYRGVPVRSGRFDLGAVTAGTGAEPR